MLPLMTMKPRWIIALGLCLPAVWLLTAAPQKDSVTQSAEQVGGRLFREQIRPLFEEHCQMCHSAESKQGGFDLSSSEGLLRGGGRGSAITPGNAKGSLLYKLVAHEETPAMPYKASKLSKEAIALLELWINLGAPTPAVSSATSTASPAGTTAVAGSAKGLEHQFFAENVRPVLQSQCFNCHGGKF